MKWLKYVLLITCLLMSPLRCVSAVEKTADVQEEFERAGIEYLAAMVCMGTYHDRIGDLMRYQLGDLGWEMKPYNEKFAGVDAKFFLVKSDTIEEGKSVYILAVTGTEGESDIKIDFDVTKVYFGGNSPREFEEYAAKRNLISADPMVHRGFHKYTQTAFFSRGENGETFGEYIANILKNDENSKLYLVGHSLGGAVATLGAARLEALGVNPKQMQVITFGAPAVGNQTFADMYGKNINLKRVTISGDVVKSALQSLSGGYSQFGIEEKWHEINNFGKIKHSMALYLDIAIRQYYDTKEKAAAVGVYYGEDTVDEMQGDAMVYAAPITMTLPNAIQGEKFYMERVIQSIWRKSLTNGYVIAQGEYSNLQNELRNAKNKGCKWLIVPNLQVSALHNESKDYYVSFQEQVYKVEDGSVAGVFSNAGGSQSYTPLELTMHNVMRIKEARQQAMQVE